MTHPNPMRHHFLFKRLAQMARCEIYVVGFDGLGNSLRVMNHELVFGRNIRLIADHGIRARNPALYYLLNAKAHWRLIDRALARLRIDVIVHSNIVPSVAAVLLARRRRIPVVFDCIEYYPQSSSAYFKSVPMQTMAYHVVKRLTEYLIRESDVVITVSDSHARTVKKIAPAAAVYVVPNGVDPELFSSADKTSNWKYSEPMRLDMAYVGSVDEWLDFDTILDAMRSLREEGLRTTLTVVGGSHGGHYLARLRSRIASLGLEDVVFFTGFVPYRVVPEYINRADVALAPYRRVLKNDVTPLKILEYMACRKVVVSTKIPEISRRFGNYLNFYDGTEDLACLLREIAANRAAFTKKAETGTDVIAKYSWNLLADEYYKILRSVACRQQTE